MIIPNWLDKKANEKYPFMENKERDEAITRYNEHNLRRIEGYVEGFIDGQDYSDGQKLIEEYRIEEGVHSSDCSLYNEPEKPNGQCDCGVTNPHFTPSQIDIIMSYADYYQRDCPLHFDEWYKKYKKQ